MQFLQSDYRSQSPLTQILMTLASFLIVAFGQPAWVPPMGLLAAIFGFTLFWRVMFCWRSLRFRFAAATLWFTSVQLVQLSWMTADDYQGKYIYLVWLLLSLLVGLQFGVITLVVRRRSLKAIGRVAAISSMWVLMEWSRLFLFTGFTWNPVGLSLTGALYPMQLATLVGVYGLSFWVFFTNLLVLRAWALSDEVRPILFALTALVLPYLFGFGHIAYHETHLQGGVTRVVLVQPAEPPRLHRSSDALLEWEKILSYVRQHKDKKVDLIALPEGVVPFGTYQPVYRQKEADALLEEAFPGLTLPPKTRPIARKRSGDHGLEWWVSNAYMAQAISNAMDADLVVGFDDYEQLDSGEMHSYNAAFYFSPRKPYQGRYEKRVLVPMGEYIPFEWARSIAATYGIYGSFTPGERAKVFQGAHAPPIGLSICYEETYGDLMRENRQMGAELLVNLTNDVWYPNSRLPKQHFDHARLRSIENGVPLVRACNTGVTGGVDSLGRIIAVLGENGIAKEWTADALYLEVPNYHYKTLYSQLGDGFIIGLAMIFSGIAFRFRSLSVS